MEVEQCIKDRRSVRRYLDKDVEWGLIMECLDAGRHAPSSGNLQNWKFIVVKDAERRGKIVKLCNKQFWAQNAPVLVIVCAELSRAKRMYGSRGEELYSVQNCAAATQNIMLRAYDLGLSSCWVGAFDENAIAKEIELDEKHRVLSVVTLGYGKAYSVLRRDPLENFVNFERFGNKDRDLRNLPVSKGITRNVSRVKSLMERFRRRKREKSEEKVEQVSEEAQN